MTEFWFEPAGASWPLFGSFSLVFLLLFVWNASFLRNGGVRRRKTDLAIVLLNGAAVLSTAYALNAQVRAADIDYYYGESDASWNASTPPFGSETRCQDASRYAGVWEVVDRVKPTRDQDFPSGWIDFRGDLTFEASESAALGSESGAWSPESVTGVIWLESEAWGDSIWEPSLSSDGELTLATPSFEPDAVTTIRLRRVR